ncbi:dimethyl sulfoxide reductase anchor subunit family protein [Vibrio diazotrophicus]|uniref:dimethyl sulfoxide reductase anchor subunit family protein n=1 Tax=Vibrio diazotrophicus TaxID=685 RepID=UPI000C9DD82F|nr:DmsC/YnfH family molybdoenzyme membrane anchor subunit [Vibrio diazotrophicus]PNH95846.1 dimethylsulfoxide reductase [Vibrio diazotrophicus]
MIFHEYSLIFFTVLAQTAVGAYLLVSTRALVKGHDVDQINSYKVPMFGLWAIMGLGFLFSLTHLGSPLRAFNSFNQLGSAWLSNEVFFGAAFFAVGGTQWLLSVLNKGSAGVQKALMVAAMALGCVFMYSMINVYMIDTVPTWFNVYTPLSFVMTMVVGGLLLFQFVIVAANDSHFTVDHNIIMLAFVAVAISLVVTIGKANLIGDIQSSVVKASELVDGLGCYLGVQVVLLVVGLLIWVLPMINKSHVNPFNLAIALVLILASELVGRGLFYSLQMTSGL